MFRKGVKFSFAVILIVAHITLLVGNGYAADPSVRLIVNPNKTDVSLGSEPIALTAKATGANLTYKWELKGPGRIDGEGSAVFYVLPEKVKGEAEQALLTVTVTDAAGQETTETVTFNILAPTPTETEPSKPAKKGMSRNTKIALGVGAAAALGGGLALVGGGGDGDGDGEPLNVAGVWEFSGQLTQNTCDLNAVSSIGGEITFYQNGSIVETQVVYLSLIRGSTWFFTYSGTVSGDDISLSAVDPYVLTGSGVVIHYGSGIEVQNIKDDSGSGSVNLTGACIQGCTGSCQTIWSGTWTKVN